MADAEKNAEPPVEEEGFVDISHAKDGGLLKKILVEGTGDATPPVGSQVEVHYVGTLHSNGDKFDSSRDRPGKFDFKVGVGQVIKGWDQGICSMKKGEKSILRCKSEYAYGEHGSPPKIPGGATLNFEVELFSWKEIAKPPKKMTAAERRDHAKKMKEQGTEAFKAGDYASAINRYEDGVEYITWDADSPGGHGGDSDSEEDWEDPPEQGGDADGEKKDEEKGLSQDDKELAIALLNNCAMAKLKLGDDLESAKFDCTKVLDFDDKNVKAFFRRAQAELAMGNFQACREDAAKAVEIDPSNKEAAQLATKATQQEKAQKKKEKDMYGKMFG